MKLLKKTLLKEKFVRYDLSIKNTHNFVAEGVVVHNTSAHVKYSDGKITYFSGGENYHNFVGLFNETELLEKFHKISSEKFGGQHITMYGEAYGGKQQKMSHTYGPSLKFIVFDVLIDDKWLNVPHAEFIAKELGLEFVFYKEISTDLEEIDKERDRDSTQAIRNGMGEGKMSEGVVLRPLIELSKNNGDRIIAKHKRDDFRETATPRKVVDPEQWRIQENANEIANEWVTEMRMEHVKDKLCLDYDMKNTKAFIDAMVEDIRREAAGEIVWNANVAGAISKNTALLLKKILQHKLKTS